MLWDNNKWNLMNITYFYNFIANVFVHLRYYATFKVRKIESLFYKINTCLQKTTTCIGLQVEQIFSVNTKYIFYFNFGPGFCGSFSVFFHKLQLLVINFFFNWIVLLFVWVKKVLQISKILFQTGDINIFILVSFLVDMFN